MSADLKFEFKVDLTPVRYQLRRHRLKKLAGEPKLRQYLILAYQIKDMLEKDPNITSRQMAGWLNMTPARMCQIMDVLLLCPKIQSDILISKAKRLFSLGEYSIRNIVNEPLWNKQVEMWGALLESD